MQGNDIQLPNVPKEQIQQDTYENYIKTKTKNKNKAQSPWNLKSLKINNIKVKILID